MDAWRIVWAAAVVVGLIAFLWMVAGLRMLPRGLPLNLEVAAGTSASPPSPEESPCPFGLNGC